MTTSNVSKEEQKRIDVINVHLDEEKPSTYVNYLNVLVNGSINGGNAFRVRRTNGTRKNPKNQKLYLTKPNLKFN